MCRYIKLIFSAFLRLIIWAEDSRIFGWRDPVGADAPIGPPLLHPGAAPLFGAMPGCRSLPGLREKIGRKFTDFTPIYNYLMPEFEILQERLRENPNNRYKKNTQPNPCWRGKEIVQYE